MENSTVFIITSNNNPTSQIITSSQSKSGSGVVDKFNNWVDNCQRNTCAKNCKNQNNHTGTKDMTSTGLCFCGHGVRTCLLHWRLVWNLFCLHVHSDCHVFSAFYLLLFSCSMPLLCFFHLRHLNLDLFHWWLIQQKSIFITNCNVCYSNFVLAL